MCSGPCVQLLLVLWLLCGIRDLHYISFTFIHLAKTLVKATYRWCLAVELYLTTSLYFVALLHSCYFHLTISSLIYSWSTVLCHAVTTVKKSTTVSRCYCAAWNQKLKILKSSYLSYLSFWYETLTGSADFSTMVNVGLLSLCTIKKNLSAFRFERFSTAFAHG